MNFSVFVEGSWIILPNWQFESVFGFILNFSLCIIYIKLITILSGSIHFYIFYFLINHLRSPKLCEFTGWVHCSWLGSKGCLFFSCSLLGFQGFFSANSCPPIEKTHIQFVRVNYPKNRTIDQRHCMHHLSSGLQQC